MLLEGVTQFAVGGFLRGVDGSLGDTHAAGDFGVGHAFHGKADDGAHLRREGVDRIPHEAVSLLLQIILLEGLVALAADGFNGLGVDRLAFQLIEAAVARHCVKIASHLVDVIELGTVLPITDESLLGDILAGLPVGEVFRGEHAKHGVVVLKKFFEGRHVSIPYVPCDIAHTID